MNRKSMAALTLRAAQPVLLVGYLVSFWWTHTLAAWPQALVTLAFVTASYIAGALSLARRQRKMDEVELAAMRFGAQWGLIAGTALMVTLWMTPPVQSLLLRFARSLDGPGGPDTPVPVRMFLFGVVSLFVAQEVARFVITAGWKWSMR